MSRELCTLDEFYEELFRRHGDGPAIRFRGEITTYADLDAQSAKLASAFHSLGLNESDRVAILMGNRPEFLLTEIAAARANVTTVPLNNQLSDEECEYILTDSAPDVLVVGPAFFDTVRDLQQRSLDCKHVIGLDSDSSLPIGFHSFEGVLAKAPSGLPVIRSSADDVATIFYTGGTTGEQKGTLHTHESIILNLYSHVYELEVRKGETGLLVTPLSHSAGYFAKTILMQGGTVVLDQKFDPETTLERIETDRISWLYLTPTMIAELLDQSAVADADTGALDTLVYGSAPIPTSRLKEGLDALGSVFVQFYGLTEVPNLVAVLPKSKHSTQNTEWLQSNGIPAQLANITLLDFGNEYDKWGDDIGEVGVQSPYAMTGYTDDDLTAPRSDSKWIRTGDIGRIDDNGRLFVLDRIQNAIVSDDQLVYSTEVESVIQSHPTVREVAVIGVPKRSADSLSDATFHKSEQDVKAVLSIADGELLELDELQEFCRERLDPPAVPDSVDTVGTLPQTPYGKVDKKLLREPYW
ncbi:class I adenylate-forming enzyme family protein [Natronorubrum tibetense]|uniref:AMP-dependent synthetase/ligase n=1 Tax=Natronorubrum tibetense GA33 TaxID=1114856 RepID=L9VN75_9EURY|nr:AMP-binding protein [Natronorubrum tibetense]ELY37703.1 AMP-dependent synthetase/ligase [Natronorubrum tibetense GA33]